jgi:hypothetical protein
VCPRSWLDLDEEYTGDTSAYIGCTTAEKLLVRVVKTEFLVRMLLGTNNNSSRMSIYYYYLLCIYVVLPACDHYLGWLWNTEAEASL